jgi:hypothetical protein
MMAGFKVGYKKGIKRNPNPPQLKANSGKYLLI